MSGTACKLLLCWPHVANQVSEVNRIISDQVYNKATPFKLDDDALEKLVDLGLKAEAIMNEAYTYLTHEVGY